MLEFNQRSNTLEQREYKYMLQDVEKPNLYRHLYNYDEVPKIPFNHRHVPMRPPEGDLITDTTFRDGQQAREPYTVERLCICINYCTAWAGRRALSANPNFSSTVRKTGKRSNAVWNWATSIPDYQLDPGGKGRFPVG